MKRRGRTSEASTRGPTIILVWVALVLVVCLEVVGAWEGALDADVVRFLAERGLSPPAMDLDQVERTKRHYDAHAKTPTGSRKDAMRQRQQGAAIQLKKFHNEVKRELIRTYAGGARRLLDLACGRGGDLQKWADAEVREVVAVDLSPKEIEEARRRYRELRGKRVQVDFQQTDDVGVTSPLLFGPQHSRSDAFDAVTCMFALHYFFASEAALRHLLTTVAANLRPGGYFFGVCPDGARVQQAITSTPGAQGLTNKVFGLKPVLDGKISVEAQAPGSSAWGSRVGGTGVVEAEGAGVPGTDGTAGAGSGSGPEVLSEGTFGVSYMFALADTVTGQVEDSSGSIEYLVREDALVHLAEPLGLRPVTRLDSNSLCRLLSQVSAASGVHEQAGVFKHFAPRYSGEHADLLEQVSKLNCAFVFVKDGGREPGAAGRACPGDERGVRDEDRKRDGRGAAMSDDLHALKRVRGGYGGDDARGNNDCRDGRDSDRMLSGAKLCRDFVLQGRCRFGDRCRFSHQSGQDQQPQHHHRPSYVGDMHAMRGGGGSGAARPHLAGDSVFGARYDAGEGERDRRSNAGKGRGMR